jgi:hypothetical protein
MTLNPQNLAQTRCSALQCCDTPVARHGARIPEDRSSVASQARPFSQLVQGEIGGADGIRTPDPLVAKDAAKTP